MIERQAAPLRTQTVDALREGIVRGRFRPGERLKERPLVEELRVSRTVIREALRQLESERLIRIEPQVGPMVVRIGADEARQLYEVRAALEATAARLAAKRRTADELAGLQASLRSIERRLEPLSDLLAAKREFYDALIRSSHNPIIGEQLAGVQARISQLRRVTLSEPGRGPVMLEELERVVGAIEHGDADAAYSASIDHVAAAQSIAMKHFEEDES